MMAVEWSICLPERFVSPLDGVVLFSRNNSVLHYPDSGSSAA
jgi:hypothetical protein